MRRLWERREHRDGLDGTGTERNPASSEALCRSGWDHQLVSPAERTARGSYASTSACCWSPSCQVASDQSQNLRTPRRRVNCFRLCKSNSWQGRLSRTCPCLAPQPIVAVLYLACRVKDESRRSQKSAAVRHINCT